MSGGCTALSLYDDSTDELTAWGEKLCELGSQQSNSSSLVEMLNGGQTTVSTHLDTVCEREAFDPDALGKLTQERLESAEEARQELKLPESCPHETYTDDRCIFHLREETRQEIDVADIRRAFLKKIEAEGDEYSSGLKQFVGAKIPALDLEYIRIDSADNHPIDLRLAKINDLCFDDGVFQQELRLDYATITGRCSCYSAEFQKRVSFEGVEFEAPTVSFEKARFDGVARFSDAEFNAPTVTFNKSLFNDVAEFKHTDFAAEEVTFEKTFFNMEACFDEVTFNIETARKIEHINFEKATFTDDFSLKNASIRQSNLEAGNTGITVSFRHACSTGNEVIINGRFGTFQDVSYLESARLVDGNDDEINKVTLKGADFSDGTVEMTGAKIAGHLVMTDIDLTNTDVECNDMDVYKQFKMANASFSGGEVLFNNTTVRDDVSFSNVAFTGNERISYADTEFQGDVEFDNSKLVADKSDFEQMTVQQTASFNDVDLRCCKISFADAEFGWLYLHNLQVDCESLDMTAIAVDGPAIFDRSEFNVEEAEFTAATFNDELNFKKASLVGEIIFDRAEFLGDTIDMSYLDAESADLQFVETRTTRETGEKTTGTNVRFHEATITDGRFRQPLDSKTVYDFERATVGDIQIEFHPEEAESESLFEYFRFKQTDFNGFDFSDGEYRANLKENHWKIHTVIAAANEGVQGRVRRFGEQLRDYAGLVRSGSNPAKDPDELEATYRKAKIGADRAGDSEASSKFFQQELAYRRRSHGYYVWAQKSTPNSPNPTLPERVTRAWLWLTNTLLWLISGYGERPKRVIISSLVTIGLFAGTYELAWYALGLTPPETVQGTGASIILSAEMFTAIILGGGEVANTVVRVISYIQGFIGSLFIALFVLTITRAVRR